MAMMRYGAFVVSGFAPARGDLVIDERNESVVGDGDAMGVVA
jgi:hypothetical protein